MGRRHEALRTAFFTDKNNQPLQDILRQPLLHLEHTYISDEAEIAAGYAKIKSHHYDLGRGETMKIVLLSLSDKSQQLIVGYHHITMDGMSLEVLLADLQLLYDQKPMSAVSVQYPDFSHIQHKEHSSGQWHKELEFWKSGFADLPSPLPILPISTKTARSPLTRYAFNISNLKSRTHRFLVTASVTGEKKREEADSSTAGFPETSLSHAAFCQWHYLGSWILQWS